MKFGFVGAGNMGGAIIGGMVNKYDAENIFAFDKNIEVLNSLSSQYGVKTVFDIKEVLKCDFLFLCVKPNVIEDVILDIKDDVSEDTTVISIAAGKSIGFIEQAFGKDVGIVRVMPNTPALVGAGMSAICSNNKVLEEKLLIVKDVFSSLGNAECVTENLMDAVTGISGSSPAYVFMFIEALADAAVQGGMTRDRAYEFAAWAVMGSAKMVIETKRHPGELKDMVCSPGGTTIDAVASLEQDGFRNAVMRAVKVCIEKSKKM